MNLKPRIEVWDITKIVPYGMNAKNHDKKQVDKIAKSIKEFGWDQPIVVDASGEIIKGHGRRLAAISLGLTQIPVWVRDDLTPDQVRAARLADNRVAISDLDSDILQQELASLNYSLEGFFDAKELDFMMSADLGEIDTSGFVDDIEEEVAQQTRDTEVKLTEVDHREVKIDKALGFKAIKGADERAVVMFMAQIEEETNLKGADAFVAFIKELQGV